MRRIRYAVASSLDGYIAGPNGESDWITMDPEIDFAGLFDQFETFLIGRRTFETMADAGGPMPGTKVFVFSRTLRQSDYPAVTIGADQQAAMLADLKASPGKDIWLFGGGSLFRSLAEMGLVDTVEVGVCPVLLGSGTPLLAATANRINLTLTSHRTYKTGIVSLEYAIR